MCIPVRKVNFIVYAEKKMRNFYFMLSALVFSNSGHLWGDPSRESDCKDCHHNPSAKLITHHSETRMKGTMIQS